MYCFAVSGRPLYVSRILRLPLVSADGAAIGKIDDIVLLSGSAALGLEGYARIDISYASISRVEVDAKGSAHMQSVNETGHIDGVRESVTDRLGHRPT